jgi:hypothetical protein
MPGMTIIIAQGGKVHLDSKPAGSTLLAYIGRAEACAVYPWPILRFSSVTGLFVVNLLLLLRLRSYSYWLYV